MADEFYVYVVFAFRNGENFKEINNAQVFLSLENNDPWFGQSGPIQTTKIPLTSNPTFNSSVNMRVTISDFNRHVRQSEAKVTVFVEIEGQLPFEVGCLRVHLGDIGPLTDPLAAVPINENYVQTWLEETHMDWEHLEPSMFIKVYTAELVNGQLHPYIIIPED